ncbi:MarC family protein [Ruegeria jejuensis]|uniref:MarC family protein n=1 Tax=Ruegeria jejuensis TaxID=3233338 RepID=UPI00355C9B25
MLEASIIAFATFFATVGPPDVAVVFAALAGDKTPSERRRLAIRATLIGAAILLFFAFLGKPLLSYLGISLAALRTAGGILLLLIAIDMVFARMSGGTSTTSEEEAEAADRDDITVFPLAMPLIAGPGAIGAVILLVADANGDPVQVMTVIGSLIAVLLVTLLLMIGAAQFQKYFGMTGAQVVSRVLGILLAALAVQFLFDGIKESGLLI